MQNFILLTEEQLRQVVAETVKTEIEAGFHSFTHAPAENPVQKDELLTRKEASKILGVSLPTLHDWTKQGTIKGHRIGTRVRYKRTELEQSLKEICVRRKTA